MRYHRKTFFTLAENCKTGVADCHFNHMMHTIFLPTYDPLHSKWDLVGESACGVYYPAELRGVANKDQSMAGRLQVLLY